MIPYFRADGLQHPNISHGFFTRVGGVSEALYASLNIGYGSGDNLEIVHENRRRVLQALGSNQEDVVTCHQIHSNMVHVLVEPTNDITMQGDALVTNLRGLAIGVLTADCVPVLFADMEAGIVAAAHAGWKGSLGGILENTVEAMITLGAKRESIIAAIGPCIQQPSYEVGQDVFDAFTKKNTYFSKHFLKAQDGVHYWFDVGGLAADVLMRLGIAKIEKLDYDTYQDAEQFFSFRRSTHRNELMYGRQISAIMMK